MSDSGHKPSSATAGVQARIDEGVRARAAEPPPLSLRRTETLEPEIRALAASIDELHAAMGRFGDVTTTRDGWAGRLELFVKGVLRKLVQRHLDQEKEVHVALQTVLDRLTVVLSAERALIDENSTVLADESVRRERREREG